MSTSTQSIETLAINTIRTLSIDGVQAANSGHPGTPMALAPAAYVVWNEFMNYDPANPSWVGRDRFVLSCGHASMLLYSVLHLAGVKELDDNGNPGDGLSITLDSIKNFRQKGSPCAGHPEFGDAAGIETTTGPLGQGIANSVGMAMAGKWFGATYGEMFDFDTYVLCSDGDVMEGIGCEAASVAGHLKLSNLCWIYDDNNITIEGETELAFSEDVAKRFEGLGWNTVTVEDANDLSQIRAALNEFKNTNDKPTLVVLKSVIGWGSPNKQNTHGVHGSPLGDDEIALTKDFYGWPNEKFVVPEEVVKHFESGIGSRGSAAYQDWIASFEEYKKSNSSKAAEVESILQRELPTGWDKDIPTFEASEKGDATRNSSGKVINAIAPNFPWMVGGSADLAPSTKTFMNGLGDFSSKDYSARNLHFGIREHSMAAICNGMSLCGIRSYGATFFVFTDYMRPSMRLSSIMHQPVLYVLTHDSIGLGEDGPTHQPVEHLAACRAIPGLIVMRPSDANEVAEAYRTIMQTPDHPVALVLTRQNCSTICRDKFSSATGVAKGGYVLAGSDDAEVVIMGTGSEIDICIAAYEELTAAGTKVQLVSMPSMELFDQQDQAYRDSVIPPSVTARVAVEAGICQGWEKYLGGSGEFVGMSSFGASAPFEELYEMFGITSAAVVAAAKKSMG